MKKILTPIFFFLFSFFPLRALAQGFTDPLEGATVDSAIFMVITFMLALVGLLALAAIVYGGIRIITGFGNQSAVEQGKKTIFWAIAGLVIIALAYIIIGVITNALGVTGAPS